MPKWKRLLILASVLSLLPPMGTSAQSSSPPPKTAPGSRSGSIGVLIGLLRFNDPTAYRSSSQSSEGHLDWVPVEGQRSDDADATNYERADDTELDSPYETIWLAASPSGVTVRPLQDIIVPHKDTFWRVGTNISRLRVAGGNNWQTEEFVWRAPIGTIPTLDSTDEVVCVGYDESLALDYVGPAYYAFTDFHTATCAHYDEGHSFAMVPLEPEDPKTKNTEIAALLGPKANAAWKYLAASVAPKNEEPAQADLDADPCEAYGYSGHPSEWTLRHSQGSWHAYAKFHGAGGGICNRWETNQDLQVALPRSLVGRNTLPVPWKQLLRSFPTILDAFPAPRGDYLVIVAEKQLTLVGVRGGGLGPILARVSIPHGRVVMAEWALGSHVATWDHQLAALPTPSVTASAASDIPD
jgi:hypothetical protein